MKNLFSALLCLLGILSAFTPVEAKNFWSITGNTIGTDQTICSNTTPAPLTGSIPGGGIGIFSYQWQVSSTSATAGFANIAGATATGYAPGVLTANRWYRRVVTSGIETDISTAVAITVTPVINAPSNTVTANQTICFNAVPATLNGSIPTGGDGVYAYQWQSSTDNIIYNNIAGATTINYTPGALTVNTWFRRIVLSGGCSHTSNSVKMTITPVITGGLIPSQRTSLYVQARRRWALPDPHLPAEAVPIPISGKAVPPPRVPVLAPQQAQAMGKIIRLQPLARQPGSGGPSVREDVRMFLRRFR